MRRIIENFGQMQAAGKLTGTELRDLARGAFLPINRVLDIMGESLGLDADKTGKLRTELQGMVSSGETDVKTFFEAFNTMVARDFPNSVGKASKSFAVVKSNLMDFLQSVIGWRVITPTLDLISGRMSSFIEKFMTPEILVFSEQLGDVFAYVAESVFKLVDALFSGDSQGALRDPAGDGHHHGHAAPPA
jgi:tape measure domain-containing protein